MSILKEIAEDRLRNNKARKELDGTDKIQEIGSTGMSEDLRQRLKVKVHKIQRCEK